MKKPTGPTENAFLHHHSLGRLGSGFNPPVIIPWALT